MAKTHRTGAKGAARSTATKTTRGRAAGVPAGGIRVRATKDGYYGDQRRRTGDVFTLLPIEGTFHEKVLDANGDPKRDRADQYIYKEVDKTLSAEDQFSKKWMEKVDASTPENTTTGNEVLRQQHDEEMRARRSGARGGEDVVGADD